MAVMRMIVAGGVALALAALVAGFLGGWAAPLDSLSHFRHGLAAALAVGVGLCWAMGRGRWAGAALAGIAGAAALSFPHVPGAGPPAVGDGTLKLIQFNVRIHNPREADAARWILAERPDVLMLQEVLDETHPSFRALQELLPHGVSCRSVGFGEVAVRTRFPVMAGHCAAGEGLAWVQVNMDGTPVTFASLHLPWPWPGRQGEQLARLQPVFEAMPRPVVLGGDFNAAPWSAAVKRIEQLTGGATLGGLRLSFRPDVLHSGHGWPALPIDHVLLPQGWRAASAALGPDQGSDHRPMVVEAQPP